jgi:HK97 gp10 family phage protein
MVNHAVKIEGLSELKDVLRTLPDATAKNVLRRIGAKGLSAVVTVARSLAPRKTGRLARSIIVATKLSRSQRAMYVKTGDDVEIFGGATALPHATLQEFGSKHNRPHPFLRPAWDSEKERLLAGIGEELWNEIQKAVARRARKLAKL